MHQRQVYKANLNGFYVNSGKDMGCPCFDSNDTIKGGSNSFGEYIANTHMEFPQQMGGLWDDIKNAGSKLLDSAVSSGQKALTQAATKEINKALGVSTQPTLSADQIAQGYSLNSSGQIVPPSVNSTQFFTQSDPNMKYYLMGGAAFLGTILLIAVLKK